MKFPLQFELTAGLRLPFPHLKTFIYDYHIYEGCTAAKKSEIQKPDFETVFEL